MKYWLDTSIGEKGNISMSFGTTDYDNKRYFKNCQMMQGQFCFKM